MLHQKRIGVTNFILGNSIAIIIWSIATVVICESFVQNGTVSKSSLTIFTSASATVVGMLFYALSERRLRDLNLAAWLTKLLALPIPGLIILPYLCFTPGSTGVNDFGEEPASPGLVRVLFTIILALLAFTFFTGAWSTYHATMRMHMVHLSSP